MSVEKWKDFGRGGSADERGRGGYGCAEEAGRRVDINCLIFYPAWGRHRDGRRRCTLALLPTI